jgi:hypothetical protein
VISAAVGAGKDTLGRTYSELAQRHGVVAFDLDALVAGTDDAAARS